jgi:hypothetical protein
LASRAVFHSTCKFFAILRDPITHICLIK